MDTPPRSYKEAWLSYKSSKCLKSQSNGSDENNFKKDFFIGVDLDQDHPRTYLEYAMYVVMNRVFSVFESDSSQQKKTINELYSLYESNNLIGSKEINHFINNKFYTFSINGASKLTLASHALAIFKKLKEITLSVIFTNTRNFSIQKNLSISA